MDEGHVQCLEQPWADSQSILPMGPTGLENINGEWPGSQP